MFSLGQLVPVKGGPTFNEIELLLCGLLGWLHLVHDNFDHRSSDGYQQSLLHRICLVGAKVAHINLKRHFLTKFSWTMANFLTEMLAIVLPLAIILAGFYEISLLMIPIPETKPKPI